MLQRLWQFTEFPFHPEKLHYYETIFTLGNGYLGTRAAFEEGYDGDTPATLVHGIYNHAEGTLVPELVSAPNWLDIRITIDGTPFKLVNQNNVTLQPKNGAVLGYRRTLHLDRAALRREVLFRAESGSIVRLVFERFASLHDVHVLCQRVQITVVNGTPEIEIESALQGDVHNNGTRHWQPEMKLQAEGGLVGLEAVTQQSGYVLGMAAQLITDLPTNAQITGLRPSASAKTRLKTEETVTFDKITAIFTSRDTEQPLLTALAKVKSAVLQGYDGLYAAHKAEWAAYWADNDIQVEGDEEAQRALRFTMYHLLIAAPRQDSRVSIGAKTLSGLGYKGHVFWDTELFIVPPFSVTQPKLARNLLLYRYHNLQGARNKAKANGYEGAMFPWESTDTGEETTPQWSDPEPDGSRIRIWTGDSEQHISTDIAYAVHHYWQWTGEDDFIKQFGAEIILDTAVFWGSRVEPKNDRFEISQQIGPDEYHENVDNSVFTNRMVVWHLQTALNLLAWLKTHAPADAERLTEQLDLTPARLAHWQNVIDKMYIPFDEANQRHIQFPGFFDMEYIPVPHYEPRTLSVQAILGHERTIQSQVIKQADVVMLMALLGEEAGPRQVRLNNWHTYAPRTDHGSSLSPAIHAWVASRLDLPEDAYHMFEHAAGIDLNDNKGNVRDGIHAAACGGLWQALVFGFCGLHIQPDNTLALDPRLPQHWKKVSFSVYYRGKKQSFVIENPA